MTKEESARKIISDSLELSTNPVLGCSWGKDSTVLYHMLKDYRPDIEMIYCMNPKMHNKNLHAIEMAGLYNVKMHVYPPSMVDYIQDEDYFEVLHYYYVNGTDYYVLYNGCVPFSKYEPYFCAVDDLLNTPTVPSYTFKWDCVFHGQKEVETAYVMENYKIKPIHPFGYGILSNPLYNWTDKEVINYLDSHNIPYQKERYKDNPTGKQTGNFMQDDLNHDVFPTCSNCLDYRNEGKTIECPKYGKKEWQGRTKTMNERLIRTFKQSMGYMTEVKNG